MGKGSGGPPLPPSPPSSSWSKLADGIGIGDNKFTAVLPVLFYEFLALSLTKSIVPGLITSQFGDYSYFLVGVIETLRGLLSFISCPFFGKLSDKIGRKRCLLATVVGTTFPVVVLSFTENMWIFGFFSILSGFFTATFPLTFAYISDLVDKKNRAPAYGLALATFGLSFCIGPITGGVIAAEYGRGMVWMLSVILIVLDIAYIITSLPESAPQSTAGRKEYGLRGSYETAIGLLPNTWNFKTTFRVFQIDPFMTQVALIIFLYYTAVWAIVSTLMVYVTRQLHFSPITVGWLLSCYGLSTMFAEGVLVRLIVPLVGEMQSIRIGLVAFAAQCTVLAFSSRVEHIFLSVFFSMLANLVYPSVSSLVSKIIDEENQGEALGALNGLRALTEGFGPLIFGGLMAAFEHFPLPGAPYLIAGFISLWAFLHTFELPDQPAEISMFIAKSRQKSDDGADEIVGLLEVEAGEGMDER